MEWARTTLSQLGFALVGPVEQPHVRPWSTVLRLPTEAGSVWLKACGFEHDRRERDFPVAGWLAELLDADVA